MKPAKTFQGSSFHGHTINTTVNKLLKVLGEPSEIGGDKTNYEWEMLTDEGQYFTVYDWKNYGGISKDAVVNWHVGGDTEADAAAGLRALRAAL